MNCQEAFDSIEPIGEERLQAAEILNMLSHIVSVIAATHGSKIEPKQLDEHMPVRFYRQPKPVKPPSQTVAGQIKRKLNLDG